MTTTKIKEEMIAAAILWWVEKLGGPPHQESQKRFASELKSFLEQKSQNERLVTLGTDYAPEWPLSEICQKANVSGARFPNKTTMWIDWQGQTVTWQVVRGPGGQVYPPQ